MGTQTETFKEARSREAAREIHDLHTRLDQSDHEHAVAIRHTLAETARLFSENGFFWPRARFSNTTLEGVTVEESKAVIIPLEYTSDEDPRNPTVVAYLDEFGSLWTSVWRENGRHISWPFRIIANDADTVKLGPIAHSFLEEEALRQAR